MLFSVSPLRSPGARASAVDGERLFALGVGEGQEVGDDTAAYHNLATPVEDLERSSPLPSPQPDSALWWTRTGAPSLVVSPSSGTEKY